LPFVVVAKPMTCFDNDTGLKDGQVKATQIGQIIALNIFSTDSSKNYIKRLIFDEVAGLLLL
jgi:hypothetical protein